MYYFIADLHLSENEPEITAQFLHFLTQYAPLADAVYIQGDLFDFWVGDDEQSALIVTIKQALRQLTSRGVSCYFQHGNRDFLIGSRFAQETGVELLPDYHLISLYGQQALLCHGDTLCIDDVKYQQFRHRAHQKWRQWLFLHLPLRLRLHIAQKIRRKSQQDKRQKSASMMDVNQDFSASVAADFGVDYIIHGHTHRQAVYHCQFFTDSDRLAHPFKRIVLGDWHAERISILVFQPDGFRLVERFKDMS